jgi:hypothetical protein
MGLVSFSVVVCTDSTADAQVHSASVLSLSPGSVLASLRSLGRVGREEGGNSSISMPWLLGDAGFGKWSRVTRDCLIQSPRTCQCPWVHAIIFRPMLGRRIHL